MALSKCFSSTSLRCQIQKLLHLFHCSLLLNQDTLKPIPLTFPRVQFHFAAKQRLQGFSTPHYHKPLTPEVKYHFEYVNFYFHFLHLAAIIFTISITYMKLMQGLRHITLNAFSSLFQSHFIHHLLFDVGWVGLPILLYCLLLIMQEEDGHAQTFWPCYHLHQVVFGCSIRTLYPFSCDREEIKTLIYI